jgi:hypothetical protein
MFAEKNKNAILTRVFSKFRSKTAIFKVLVQGCPCAALLAYVGGVVAVSDVSRTD